ncbi:hypothetical protein EGH22_20670 [Halomicroarcula sp. F28]|uniref:hypothetical protein n=1 Tax=Haloarcula salinisoli TaxID=2487746 RepID=UPI001C73D9EB|nr:hypothetical protein [Halomicroarcula salinisoli]MBX0288748.1 hypothetical protein [Halomicroarcula salinisoli]
MSRNNELLTVAEAAVPTNQLISQTVGTPDRPAAWQDLETDVPTLRSQTEAVAFAECVLVELRHEPVAARFQSAPDFSTEWILSRTEHLSVTASEPFARVRIDRRHGVDIEPCSRAEAREGLCTVLTQSELGRVDVQPLAALSVGGRGC